MISHITPDRRDVVYDSRAHQAGLPVTVHHHHGVAEPAILVMDPGQMELYALQLERAIAKRKAALESVPR
ncbi:hypothetical protein [Streptomyces sp. NRRL S-337]|uniref:hypothetical protein n=1 Tax=Streptomyces sp. NRRL S-337 TaxID=1463900 RepID=UPI00068B5D3B|nr:hypothetical protein [Streptomyces sp. NRRL S-337]